MADCIDGDGGHWECAGDQNAMHHIHSIDMKSLYPSQLISFPIKLLRNKAIDEEEIINRLGI